MRQLRERYEIRTTDGEVFKIDNGTSANVLTDEGLGMPPVEFVTQRGPFQHGEEVLDYFLRPRTVQIILRKEFCSRILYWAGRTALLDSVRPNRAATPAPFILRKYLPNGTKRDLDVYIEQGPNFEPPQNDRWDEHAYQETLRLTAYNPVFYDPIQQSAVATSPTTELTFPITFPILFESFVQTLSISYLGTWEEYPIITANGPVTNPSIHNETTNEQVELSYEVPAGQSVIFDFRYGVKTVKLNDGTNLVSYLSSNSDLGSFHLAPDPIADQGVNVLKFYGSNTDLNTNFSMTWYKRYIGI